MTLKANLLEELSKLRLSRERPMIKQTKRQLKQKEVQTKEEKDLLNQLTFEGD